MNKKYLMKETCTLAIFWIKILIELYYIEIARSIILFRITKTFNYTIDSSLCLLILAIVRNFISPLGLWCEGYCCLSLGGEIGLLKISRSIKLLYHFREFCRSEHLFYVSPKLVVITVYSSLICWHSLFIDFAWELSHHMNLEARSL